MAIRDQLAEFSADLRYEDLPADVVETARLLISSQVATTAAACRIDPDADVDIARFFRELGGKKESSLVTQACKVPCINAAFANTAISWGVFDSMQRTTVHLSALIPAVVAVAERQRASGRDLILATVIGCEVLARVGLALGAAKVYNRGFHPTSLCAPLGCAVAAGKLLGLKRDVMAEALSIGAIQGAGAPPWPQFPRAPKTNRIQVGRAAQGGVLAALLAQRGVIGISEIFEDRRGFASAHSASPNLAEFTRDMGKTWEVKQTTFNRFGVGIYIIPGIEALLDLRAEHNISGDDIAQMTYRLPTAVVPLVGAAGYPSGDALAAASKSSRYVLAFSAYKGEAELLYSHDYKTAANLDDPRHKQLFQRTDVVADSELDKLFPGTWPCKLTIKLKDGREVTRFHKGTVRGSPENPLTQDDVDKELDRVLRPVMAGPEYERLTKALRRLDRVDDVSRIARLMANAVADPALPAGASIIVRG
ncbi:MAG: MmgE/PrpD family protein [Chloroflexi bacterium]|nr:MmgE/PrpD family protein [Chloroflexota bacterium]